MLVVDHDFDLELDLWQPVRLEQQQPLAVQVDLASKRMKKWYEQGWGRWWWFECLLRAVDRRRCTCSGCWIGRCLNSQTFGWIFEALLDDYLRTYLGNTRKIFISFRNHCLWTTLRFSRWWLSSTGVRSRGWAPSQLVLNQTAPMYLALVLLGGDGVSD